MNVDRNLIRHWAMLFESEEAKRDGDVSYLEEEDGDSSFMSEHPKTLELLKDYPRDIALFDLDRFDYPLGRQKDQCKGIVSMLYDLEWSDNNRVAERLDEFYDSIGYDRYDRRNLLDGGDCPTFEQEEEIYRYLKSNPEYRKSFIKLVDDLADMGKKNGGWTGNRSVPSKNDIDVIGNGRPKFLGWSEGWGKPVILDSLESVYKFALAAFGYDGKASLDDYEYPPTSGYWILLVNHRNGDGLQIYIGDDKDKADALYDEIRERYPSGHSDYFTEVGMFSYDWKNLKSDKNVGVSEQEGKELFRKYNVKVPADKTHPVYRLSHQDEKTERRKYG